MVNLIGTIFSQILGFHRFQEGISRNCGLSTVQVHDGYSLFESGGIERPNSLLTV